MQDYSILAEALQLGGVSWGEIVSPTDVLRGRYAVQAGPHGGAIKGGTREGGYPLGGAVGGLSHPHNSPLAKFWVGASLVKVTRGLTMEQHGGGLRSRVTTFSPASRRRMLYKLATVKRSELPLFVTLTYPDAFPADAETWGRHLDNFRKRFQRRGWGAVWKKELKTRKSGENMGKIAPHFHLLVWGSHYQELRAWCAGAWYEIVGSGDADHLAAGVRVEIIHTPNGVRGYVGKYITKEDEDLAAENAPAHGYGRFWGVINSAVIPWGDEVIVDFDTQKPVVDLLRLMRRFMRMRRRGNLPGLTMICNAERWFDNLGGLIT